MCATNDDYPLGRYVLYDDIFEGYALGPDESMGWAPSDCHPSEFAIYHTLEEANEAAHHYSWEWDTWFKPVDISTIPWLYDAIYSNTEKQED